MYIYYKLTINNNSILLDLLDWIIITSTNLRNLIKDSKFTDLLKKYYNLNIDFDIREYCIKNKEYLQNLINYKKKYNLIDFDKSSKSEYDRSFITKTINAYNNLNSKYFNYHYHFIYNKNKFYIIYSNNMLG